MSKLDTIKEYDYYLAFENSNCIDYVSEKMFDGLISGTVPVYLGAPNVDEYLPGNNCIIKATDFANGADLAKFLLELSSDRQRYSEYLKWKKKSRCIRTFSSWFMIEMRCPCGDCVQSFWK